MTGGVGMGSEGGSIARARRSDPESEVRTVDPAIPVDIWSVKAAGLESWLAGPAWPVSDQELRDLYRDVDALLIRTINESGPDVGDAFSVVFNSTGEYFVSVILAEMAKERLRKAGIRIVCRSGTRHFSPQAGGADDLTGLTAKGFLPPLPSGWERVRGSLRAYSDQAKYHGIDVKYALDRMRGRECLCFFTPSSEKEWYAASVGKGITIVHPRQFMPARKTGGGSPIPGSAEAVERQTAGLQKLAADRGVRLAEAVTAQMREVSLRCLGPVGGYIAGIRSLLRGRRPTEILVDGLGNSFKRSLCMAGRREGFRMVGFSHGNTAGMSAIPTHAYVDMAMVDTYVAPTRAAARLFGGLQARYRLKADHEVQVLSSDDGTNRKVWEANRGKPLPAAIRTVLVVENPILDNINRDLYLYWPHHLELLLRIGKSLRNAGVRTVLKRHPDRLRESEGLYGPYFDEVLTERFEKVYNASDAILFPYICTSTFGFSLLSEKPIFFFETMLDSVQEELHAPLRRRCRVIPSAFDAVGRLAYDEARLQEALRVPPGAPDPSFVERYMLA